MKNIKFPQVDDIFEDDEIIKKVQEKLSIMFQIAELESSRAGKIGMEVGTIRERIITALFLSVYNEDDIGTEIPITESETDFTIFGKPNSIKTITGIGGVKVIWTVDAQKAKEFVSLYSPSCDLILALIKWTRKDFEHPGGLYFIPLKVQKQILKKLGKDAYLKLPKEGTNPRGVELSKQALELLITHNETKCITVQWKKEKLNYNVYQRWVEEWKK